VNSGHPPKNLQDGVIRCVAATFFIILFSLMPISSQQISDLKQIEQSVLFIYDGSTSPCSDPPSGHVLLPLGTGFVSGIAAKGVTLDAPTWTGVKFVITAKHVVANRQRVIFRLNTSDGEKFARFPLDLKWNGPDQNSFVSDKPEVDLAAIHLPKIPDTDPALFDYPFIMDRNSMAAYQVEEGADVFTIGYLYGYSGKKKNYVVKKFGRISLLTEEQWLGEDSQQKAYLIELQNVPGLSGAPVFLQTTRILVMQGHLGWRQNPPLVVGVIKDLLLAPITSGQTSSQGVAAVEPGSELKALLKQIATRLNLQGLELELTETPTPK
jgi:hypothetical protein